MIQVRRSSERGMFENEWLKSFHSFSFDTYYDPKHNNFGPLRVINHDFVKAKNGFGTHPHRDMEIITYVLRGEISHKDSLGNEMKVPAGDIQRMSAGTGIFHSEHNLSDEELELFQIWILPEKRALLLGMSKDAQSIGKKNRLQLIVSPNGRDGSLKIHNNVEVSASRLTAGSRLEVNLDPDRLYWVQLAKGKIEVNGIELSDQDAAGFTNEGSLKIEATTDSELLFFDLPNLQS